MKDSTFRGPVTCRSVISRRGATGQRQRDRGAEEEEVCGEACTPMNRATLVTLHRSIHNGGEGLLLPKHVFKKITISLQETVYAEKLRRKNQRLIERVILVVGKAED